MANQVRAAVRSGMTSRDRSTEGTGEPNTHGRGGVKPGGDPDREGPLRVGLAVPMGPVSRPTRDPHVAQKRSPS